MKKSTIVYLKSTSASNQLQNYFMFLPEPELKDMLITSVSEPMEALFPSLPPRDKSMYGILIRNI